MAIKVNSLNPFDRDFFGKTMADWVNKRKYSGKMLYPSNLKQSSIDDFNKHFQDKIFQMPFEKSPAADEFSQEAKIEIPDKFRTLFD